MSKTLEIITFISMNGRTAEAISFYKNHFKAEIQMIVTYEDMTNRIPGFHLTEENRTHISHSILK